MASCDSQTLKANAACLGACMTEIELLAAIACLLATQNGMACDAATLKSQAACIWPCMSRDELLASIAYTLCNGGGGGGGSSTAGTTDMALGNNVAPPSDGSVPTFRVFDTISKQSWYNEGTIAVPVWNNV